MKILVLQGGHSNEREVSLRSSANVQTQLATLGHHVVVADPAKSGFESVLVTQSYDVIFPVLHGACGEDGTLQAQLEELGVRFVGSGSAACALTFAKNTYRKYMQQNRILVADGAVVNLTEFNSSPLRNTPYVLKPISGGSSVDTIIVADLDREPNQSVFTELFHTYGTMLLEQYVAGLEITVGVLGDQVLPVIHIIPPEGKSFDYENKYNGATQEITNPSQISKALQRRAQQLAYTIHELTGCRHLSRTDMIISPAGDIYVLETNTLPGMTEQSLYPKAARAAGYTMADLCDRLLQMATA